MYFNDLSPYQYDRREPDPTIVNVGWLSREHSYEEGPVPEDFVDALRQLVSHPINLYRGFHLCEYCPEPQVTFGNEQRLSDLGSSPVGNGEIRVPGLDGLTYVAPFLVLHYVAAHHYKPPSAFVDAVLAQR